MMMDLPRIQVTATPALSRKRARDSQDLQSEGSKAHTYFTVRGHASWDAAHQLSVHDSQDDEADEDLIPASASPRSVSSSSTWKRRRVSELHDDSELELEYVDSVPPSPWIDSHQQPSPLELTECTTPNEDQDLPKERKRHREEWEVLKGLYMEAIVAYGSNHDPQEALNLLRVVIEECHEFLVEHKDPSVLFVPLVRNVDGSWSPQNLSAPDERLFRSWSGEHTNDSVLFTSTIEHPTAFHSVCGSALMCFGNLLAKHPSLGPVARTYGRDWSGTAYYYWLSALDVFEAGDGLPNRSKSNNSVTSEDWRMSIAWGRTLVCLANEVQKRTRAAKSLPPTDKPLLVEEPKWPLNSPFHANMSKKPPLTRRLQLQRASVQDLLLLAQDHFYRGMFYMPRSGWSPVGLFNENIASQPVGQRLSSNVTQEFIKMSAELLRMTEQFEEPFERQRWAQFADVVLNSLKGDVETQQWRASILLARGKCKLASGVAKMQALSADLQEQSPNVLGSHRAQSARKTLSTAITLLEQARDATQPNREEDRHSRDLLVTALKYCGDLCTSLDERTQLYARAQALHAGSGGVAMDVSI